MRPFTYRRLVKDWFSGGRAAPLGQRSPTARKKSDSKRLHVLETLEDRYLLASTSVLDWNDGIVLYPGVTEYDKPGDAVDVRAQVSGGAVATYAWNLAQAPDATSATGQSTYDLNFSWGVEHRANKSQ